jgi:hypothetical protein
MKKVDVNSSPRLIKHFNIRLETVEMYLIALCGRIIIPAASSPRKHPSVITDWSLYGPQNISRLCKEDNKYVSAGN